MQYVWHGHVHLDIVYTLLDIVYAPIYLYQKMVLKEENNIIIYNGLERYVAICNKKIYFYKDGDT